MDIYDRHSPLKFMATNQFSLESLMYACERPRLPRANGPFPASPRRLGGGQITRVPCLQGILPAPEPQRIDQPH